MLERKVHIYPEEYVKNLEKGKIYHVEIPLLMREDDLKILPETYLDSKGRKLWLKKVEINYYLRITGSYNSDIVEIAIEYDARATYGKGGSSCPITRSGKTNKKKG